MLKFLWTYIHCICSDERVVLLHDIDTVFWREKMFCDYRLVVGQIDELLIYCKYGIRKENGIYVVDPTGCQEQIAIGNYMLLFFSK